MQFCFTIRATVFLTLFILFTCYGCTFSPSSPEFTEIDESDYGTSIPEITLSTDQDTIIVPSATNFGFSIDSKDREFYGIRIFIDGKSVVSSDKKTGVFTIEPKDYSSGYKDLTIHAYAATNTNSLADAFDVEALIFDFTWTVLFDVDPPHPINIREIETSNGTVEISWEKYDRINFQSYRLYRQRQSTMEPDLIFETFSPEDTTHTDSHIIDGSWTYFVETTGADISVEGDTTMLNIPDIELGLTHTGKSSVAVSWTKPLLYTNFSAYQIYEFFKYDEFIWQSRDINDTTYNFVDLTFGNEYSYAINLPSASKYQGRGNMIQFDFQSGFKLYEEDSASVSYVSNLIYDAETDNYFLKVNNRLVKYDSDLNFISKNLDYLSADVILSGNNLYTTISAPGNYGSNQIARINKNTLQFDEYYAPSDIINKENYVYFLTVDENEVAIFKSGFYNNGTRYSDSLIVYDLANQKHLGTFPPGFYDATHVGEDFYVIDKTLYQKTNNSLDSIAVFRDMNDPYHIEQGEILVSSQFLYSSAKVNKTHFNFKTNTYQTSNHSIPDLVKIIRIVGRQGLVYYLNSSNHLIKYDYKTEEILSDIFVGDMTENSSFWFVNDVLMLNTGLYLK